MDYSFPCARKLAAILTKISNTNADSDCETQYEKRIKYKRSMLRRQVDVLKYKSERFERRPFVRDSG